jgi:hypothetical protein
MGDKSPKAVAKKSGQKQNAANAAAKTKNAAIAARQTAGKQK